MQITECIAGLTGFISPSASGERRFECNHYDFHRKYQEIIGNHLTFESKKNKLDGWRVGYE